MPVTFHSDKNYACKVMLQRKATEHFITLCEAVLSQNIFCGFDMRLAIMSNQLDLLLFW